jgi:hypothetical protein
MPCSKCADNPNSHSFHHIGTTKHGFEIIYTCPSKTLHFDGSDPQFVEYFDEHLRVLNGKSWVWIFDCKDYTMKHMLSMNNLRNLVNYLNKNHMDKLHASYVLNAESFFGHMMRIVMPLLKKDAQKRIHVLPNCALDALTRMEQEGFLPTQVAPFLKSSP